MDKIDKRGRLWNWLVESGIKLLGKIDVADAKEDKCQGMDLDRQTASKENIFTYLPKRN